MRDIQKKFEELCADIFDFDYSKNAESNYIHNETLVAYSMFCLGVTVGIKKFTLNRYDDII